MKKLFFMSFALILLAMHVRAQKYFDVYQNGEVKSSIASSSLDSIGLTGVTSQDRKVNFYRDGNVMYSYLVSSVDSIKIFRTDEEQLVYMGLLGFNQELYEKSIDVLSTSTAGQYTSFVNNLQYKDGTILYYAVDHALDMLTSKNFETPLTSVNLVTFTDGLDQGSLMLNSNYSTDEDYLDALSDKIQATVVKGLPLTAYSIGLRGSDVSNYTLFQNNLNKLASSSDKVFEASSMSAVRTSLQEISDKIISISNKQNISLKIPGQSTGTVICFTFDGNTPENSSLYIEGTFDLANRSLIDVTYHGITATSGNYIQGTQNGIFVTFAFTGLQREDGNGLIPLNYTREYYIPVGTSEWLQNSEFSPSNNIQTTVTHSGAAIMLVLDCSSSLGSLFSTMKNYANDFINRVAGNASSFTVDAPTNVTAVIPDDNFIVRLSWNDVKHAESYDVYRSNSSSYGFTKVASEITATTWDDTIPLSGNNYYCVYACGHGITSPASTIAYTNYSLEAPRNATATVQDDNYTINVSWDSVKHAESYVVYRSNKSTSGFTMVAEGISATSWNDATPLVGNNYYRVYAVGHGLTSTASNTTSSIYYALDAPQNVTASIHEDDFTILVSWSAVSHAEGYDVYRSGSSSGNFVKVASGITATTWNDVIPLEGNNYYRVYAVGHGLTSSASTTVNVNYALEAPQNVKATIKEDDFTIIVSWDAVSYAESYDVYRSGNISGSFIKVASGITTAFWNDVTPLSGNNYYRVYAVGHGLTSPASNTTPVVNYCLAAPTNVTASIPEDQFVIRVSWNSVQYAEKYDVYRSSNLSGEFDKVAEGITSTTWDDVTPLLGNNYYFICAVANNQSSSASDTTPVVNYELDAPTNITAIYDENTGTITVSWNPVVHAESYDVYRNGTLLTENIATTSYIDSSQCVGYIIYHVKAKNHGVVSEASCSTFPIFIRSDDAVKVTVNGIDIYMAKVSGGTFQMGATEEQGSDASDYSSYELPVHQVTLSDYYIGETEVTQELWQAVMGSNPSYFKTSNQLPVEQVSWDDCQSFINELNNLTGMQFRLPTEAEWEFAARGGNASLGYKYSGSDEVDIVAWYNDNSGSHTHEVGAKAPNELGIYDMSGNVMEWCQDWYGRYDNSAQTDPTGPSSGSKRVFRGGSWHHNAGSSRVSYRLCSNVNSRYYLGFRLVLAQEGNVEENVEENAFFVNGVEFNMVKVDGGTFQMGATSEQGSDAYSNELPVHQVTLSDYYIGKMEVTQELWQTVMGSNPSYYSVSSQLPVDRVSWDDCQTFISNLNQLTGKQFRLPTEAEWEFAARGGNASKGYKYSGGNDIGQVAWYSRNSGSTTHEVGMKTPNELGIYDMSGNVMEWCQDWYGDYNSSAQTNPTGPYSGSSCVIRGGGLNHNDRSCRVSFRDINSPSSTFYYMGLRLALSASQ